MPLNNRPVRGAAVLALAAVAAYHGSVSFIPSVVTLRSLDASRPAIDGSTKPVFSEPPDSAAASEASFAAYAVPMMAFGGAALIGGASIFGGSSPALAADTVKAVAASSGGQTPLSLPFEASFALCSLVTIGAFVGRGEKVSINQDFKTGGEKILDDMRFLANNPKK